jgi:hypothetical protein
MSKLTAVREYALLCYELSSWSYVVEAWSDEEIEYETQNAKSETEAITIMVNWVDLHYSVAEDIRNS